MTEKLYDKDAYLKQFEATVVSCEKCDIGFAVILDKTAFFPEEGGQKSDTGTIDSANVTNVVIDGDNIVHYTDCEVTGKVECTLDFEPRLDKMRQHTGEHILCGVIHRMFGYDNVGFHLGDDDVTCDFNGPLTSEQILTVQMEANKAVLLNRAVKGYYPDKETLAKLDYRSKSGIEGNIRIVEIDGIDLCACCAPHVAFTGEVGLIKITDALNYKGGMRLHIACGLRALDDYQLKSDNLSYIAKTLSSTQNNAAEFFKRYVNDVTTLKQSLSELKREILEYKADNVTPTDCLLVFESGLDMNGLRQYVNALKGKYTTVCAVFSEKDGAYSFASTSDKINMRDIAKQLSDKFGARCGGTDKMIQGTVTASKQNLEKIFKIGEI